VSPMSGNPEVGGAMTAPRCGRPVESLSVLDELARQWVESRRERAERFLLDAARKFSALLGGVTGEYNIRRVLRSGGRPGFAVTVVRPPSSSALSSGRSAMSREAIDPRTSRIPRRARNCRCSARGRTVGHRAGGHPRPRLVDDRRAVEVMKTRCVSMINGNG
jgi:hypothetical protein